AIASAGWVEQSETQRSEYLLLCSAVCAHRATGAAMGFAWRLSPSCGWPSPRQVGLSKAKPNEGNTFVLRSAVCAHRATGAAMGFAWRLNPSYGWPSLRQVGLSKAKPNDRNTFCFVPRSVLTVQRVRRWVSPGGSAHPAAGRR